MVNINKVSRTHKTGQNRSERKNEMKKPLKITVQKYDSLKKGIDTHQSITPLLCVKSKYNKTKTKDSKNSKIKSYKQKNECNRQKKNTTDEKGNFGYRIIGVEKF